MTKSPTPNPASRNLRENDLVAIATLIGFLPGAWAVRTEIVSGAQTYAGVVVVCPRPDGNSMQFVISGAPNDSLSVQDWDGKRLIEGVGPEVAFAVIRHALIGAAIEPRPAQPTIPIT